MKQTCKSTQGVTDEVNGSEDETICWDDDPDVCAAMEELSASLKKQARVSKIFGEEPVIAEEVIELLPADVVDECPARIIASVAAAIDVAYQAGRAKAAAEAEAVVEKWDPNAYRGMVLVKCIGQYIEWARDYCGQYHVALYGQLSGINAQLKPDGAEMVR